MRAVRFCLLAIIIVLAMMLFSCGSKKKSVQKEEISEIAKSEKEEAISEKETAKSEKEIATSEEETAISEKETAISEKENSTNRTKEIEFVPVNENKPIQIINGNDTINVSNAKIKFSEKTEKAKSEKETEIKETENSTRETENSTRETENLTRETENLTSEKAKSQKQTDTINKNKDVKKGFPWWILIVIGIGLVAYFIFKNGIKKLPGL